MNRPVRSIEIFTMSALDLFVTAMGSFAILMMILFPYYMADKKEAGKKSTKPQPRPISDDVAVAGETVLFCIWPTRVQDYEQFVKETGYDGTDPKFPNTNDVLPLEQAWRDPGFEQGPEHPVVGVSWRDARMFCQWLTEKERKAGQIGPDHYYRLPTDAEWNAAAGPARYPWGDQWPPPADAGNLAGLEFTLPLGNTVATAPFGSFRDDFPFTSPVGSFAPNRYGLYDLAGNVYQTVLDWYRNDMMSADLKKRVSAQDTPPRTRRFARGSSWQNTFEGRLLTEYREPFPPRTRWEDTGFRCVLVVKSDHK